MDYSTLPQCSESKRAFLLAIYVLIRNESGYLKFYSPASKEWLFGVNAMGGYIVG